MPPVAAATARPPVNATTTAKPQLLVAWDAAIVSAVAPSVAVRGVTRGNHLPPRSTTTSAPTTPTQPPPTPPAKRRPAAGGSPPAATPAAPPPAAAVGVTLPPGSRRLPACVGGGGAALRSGGGADKGQSPTPFQPPSPTAPAEAHATSTCRHRADLRGRRAAARHNCHAAARRRRPLRRAAATCRPAGAEGGRTDGRDGRDGAGRRRSHPHANRQLPTADATADPAKARRRNPTRCGRPAASRRRAHRHRGRPTAAERRRRILHVVATGRPSAALADGGGRPGMDRGADESGSSSRAQKHPPASLDSPGRRPRRVRRG